MPAKRSVAQRRDLVPITDAAELYGVSTKTIRRRIADGSLTAYRFGPRLIRVDLAEVDHLLRPIGAESREPDKRTPPR